MPRLPRLALLCAVVLAAVAARAGAALAVHARPVQTPSVAGKRTRIVRFARRFLGIRYSYGGTSPASGFDCSGFTRFVYAHFGIALPHSSGAQWGLGRSISRAALRPGDLVFFDGLGHVGLYVGRGLFIHAPHTGSRVEIDSLAGSYGAGYDGARRLV